LQNNSGTIPFVSENQETHRSTGSQYFPKHVKSTKEKPLGSGTPWNPEQGFTTHECIYYLHN